VTSSFLDTTILVDLSRTEEPARSNSQRFVNDHQPSQVPFYASKEMLAGPVNYVCIAHNALLASENHMEAYVAVERRFPFAVRARQSTTAVLISDLRSLFAPNQAAAPSDLKREGLQAIALKATQMWRRANKPNGVAHVQSLACFNSGELSFAAGGEIRGPNDSFGCDAKERCAAAAYIHDDQVSLTQLIDALHPRQLDDAAQAKAENSSRRRALTLLKKNGAKLFDKRRCRNLGDAYFAVMCPKQSVLGTTNLVDFEPLCKALGKKFSKP
jgi:hypothetical protein